MAMKLSGLVTFWEYKFYFYFFVGQLNFFQFYSLPFVLF